MDESNKLVNNKLDGLAKAFTQYFVTDVTETLMENVKTTVGAAVNEKLSDMKKNELIMKLLYGVIN